MTDEEAKAIAEENERLKSNLKSYQEKATDYESLNKKVQEQEAAMKKLQDDNRAMVLAKDKDEVLKAHPDAAAFADMIIAPDKKGMEEQAKIIAERVAKEKEAAKAEHEERLRKAWGNITLPPTSHVLTEDDLKKNREESIKNGDLLGGMKAALNSLIRKARPV